MKILDLQLDLNFTETLGLSPIMMRKLGDIVILAGKNGSGKSRILKLIKNTISSAHDLNEAKINAPNQLNIAKANLDAWENQIDRIPMDDPSRDMIKGQLAFDISAAKENIRRLETIINSPKIMNFDISSRPLEVVDFVPERIQLDDWAYLSRKEWMDRASRTSQLGMAGMASLAISLIQLIVDRYANSKNEVFRTSQSESSEAEEQFVRLNDIIKSFLGVGLDRDRDGNATLYGKPIANSDLSNGQQVLLQYCVAIFAQGKEIDDHILFLDEPENHLHPSAVIDFLNTIRKHNPKGQIWISTHSIPLLSAFDPAAIWFVENGSVANSGRRPEAVLGGLLGGEDGIIKLRDFSNLPGELARNRFAFECLCSPDVIETDSLDPQSRQFHDQLRIIWKDKARISILDYGAGKGRLIANLSDYPSVTVDSINYFAFDCDSVHKESCIKNIGMLYSDASQRYFDSIPGMRSNLGDNCFDVVAMCNVLHEIPFGDWRNTFKNISTMLSPDGFLLLIEDCRLPVGEMPNSNGYIVLNTLHLIKLFGIEPPDHRFVSHDARFESKVQRGRLMAHLIPAEYLSNVTIASIKSAIDELKSASIEEIRRYRSIARTYSNSMAHAFWVHQLANAMICLEQL